MFELKVNKRLLPMKCNYFLAFGCIGPVVSFLSNISKQLGYSISTYGAMMTFTSLVSMILFPLAGIVFDRFRVKRKLFFTTMILYGVVSPFLFMYVPKITSETAVELKRDTNSVFLFVYSEDVQHEGAQDKSESFLTDDNIDQLITCRLDCQDTNLYCKNTNESNNRSDLNDSWMSRDSTKNITDDNRIDVAFKLKDVEQNENSYIFNLSSVQINGTQIPSTICQWHLKTFCRINCSNDAITELATVKTYKGNIIYLYQFWIFFPILNVYWACMMITFSVINPIICLDLLEKPEDFGKQKVWASIGFGTFSIFIGWLVDRLSINKKEKNYSPVYYSSILLSLCNIVVSTKIKISESKKSKGKLKSVFGLFSKNHVIAFYLWSAFNKFFHAVIIHFLFWYMEDLVSGNNDPSQKTWLKTLQGLALGVQCFGGEIPILFWSGWIIRKTGYIRCMALALGTMAVRMYLYTVIWNPTWIVCIELLNGVSYALAMAVKMTYAKLMSPPGTSSTAIGLMGFSDSLGESVAGVLGGYLFESYGGVWSFRFFAYFSALLCILQLVCYHFGIIKDLEDNNFVAVSTNINNDDDIKIETNRTHQRQ